MRASFPFVWRASTCDAEESKTLVSFFNLLSRVSRRVSLACGFKQCNSTEKLSRMQSNTEEQLLESVDYILWGSSRGVLSDAHQSKVRSFPCQCPDATRFVLLCVLTLIETIICPKIWARPLAKRQKRYGFQLTCIVSKCLLLSSLLNR